MTIPFSLRFMLLSALIAAFTTSTSHPQLPPDQDSERCYQLSVGPWTVPIRPLPDTIFHRPPSWFGLTTKPTERDSTVHQLRPTIVIRQLTRQAGYWTQLEPHQLRIAWSDGFTGLWILFASRADTLVGTAHLLTDDLRSSYAGATSWARATPMTCPSPSETEDVRQAGA